METIIIILISIIAFAIAFFATLKITKMNNGEYECEICHNKITPTKKQLIFSMHSDDTRKIKCPNCNKKTWCRKIQYNIV